MRYQLPNGRKISQGQAFDYNGVQYPANWLRLSTAEEREALGITELASERDYDQRFYFGYGTDGNLMPKSREEILKAWTRRTREMAFGLLLESDWMVVRQAEGGAAMDQSWKDWRASVRAAVAEKITAMEAKTSTDDLADYLTGNDYRTWPTDPNAPEGSNLMVQTPDDNEPS